MSQSYNPTFKINLVRLFNSTFATSSVAERNQLRGAISSASFRNEFGKDVIARIVDRTENESKDKNGVAFALYSKKYMESDTFKIYQKSSKVNLLLTGEMLSSMKSVDASQSIIIEMIGKKNKDKAHGHVFGLGKKKVKRDFLGLQQTDLEAIMMDLVLQYQDKNYAAAQELFSGLDGVVFNGKIGKQDVSTGVNINDLLMMMQRNLSNGE